MTTNNQQWISKKYFLKIIFLGIIFFLVKPLLISAYTGQYPWDPLYFEEVQNPAQDFQRARERTINNNIQEANNLKQTYGAIDFYSCYPCANKDTSEPSEEMGCLAQTRLCLEFKKNQKEKSCSNEETYLNGRCLKLDLACKEKYGSNSYSRYSVIKDGKYSCGCNDGYQFNNDKTSCVKIVNNNEVVESLNNICKKEFGSNSYSKYSVTFIKDDAYSCDCNNGYQFNNDKTSCVKIVNNNEVVESLNNNTYCLQDYELEDGQCITKISKPILLPQNKQSLNKSEVNTTTEIRTSVVATSSVPLQDIQIDKTDEKPSVPVKHHVKIFFGKIFSKLANWFLK